MEGERGGRKERWERVVEGVREGDGGRETEREVEKGRESWTEEEGERERWEGERGGRIERRVRGEREVEEEVE